MGGSRNVYCRGVKENSVQLQGQLASYCFEDGWQQEKWSAKAVVWRAHLFMTSSCGGEPVISTCGGVLLSAIACSYSHGSNSGVCLMMLRVLRLVLVE